MSLNAAVRVLLFGGSGQVGQALQALAPASWRIDAPSSARLSLANVPALDAYVRETRPHVIVNTAAYTRVDDAEADPASAELVNCEAPAALAALTRAHGMRFVHFSTDYVFDGMAPPYAENAETRPLNVYGRTKRDGERRVIETDPAAVVIRTAWVHAGHGTNFVGTATRLLSAGTSMRVVDDQVGAPTHAETLAHATIRALAHPQLSGLQHVTDAGVASWFDVASCVAETLAAAGRLPPHTTVTPVASSAFPRPARRPAVSLLDCHDTRARLAWTPPHWREGVARSTIQWMTRLQTAGSMHV